VTASQRDQLTDMLVKHAQWDKDKTQEMSRIASQLQLVLDQIKFLVSVILKPAIDAEPALVHLSQDQTDQSAIDQDQRAHAPKNTLLMDTAASNAHQVKSPITKEEAATQLQAVLVQDKSSELFQTATDVTPAHQTLFQMPTEEHVLDQSQFAHVLRDTLLMDMSAKNAQIDKLLIQTTTRDASQEYATLETKSLPPETTATDVTNAHKAMSQTHKELSARESSQLAAALRSMTQVAMSVFHAHHTKLPPMETKDVSQDNALDSMKSLVQLINAMHAKNAKRDLLLITSEEDA